ncbi:receptor [Dermatophagoides pteronyssinus]|uniref:Receptor n=1 Tax=Dermatophagoides pteronyssinus TaxID=6956 RepID=A0ABQ8JUR2_DERPT|nr:receptor [Dermatophagoides pteronyssinus]
METDKQSLSTISTTSTTTTTTLLDIEEKSSTTTTTTLLFLTTDTLSIYLKIIIGIILVIVILISIFGNILICVAIASDRRLRRLGNLFLVSLAIADLCVGALVMTFALANDLMEYWPFWPQLCEIWIAFDISCSTCSIINLCAIALDRFAHIKDPMLYNRWMNKRIVIIAVSIIWILSGLISFLPISLGWHKPLPSSSSSTSMVMDRMNDTPLPSSTTTMMTIIESNFDYDDRIDEEIFPETKTTSKINRSI